MKPLLLLAAAATAFAQGPASTLQVLSPSIRGIVGETMQLQAVVRDAAGVERRGDSITWTVDNAAIATVGSTNGLLTLRGLGFVRTTAAVGNVRNSLLVQVLPKRIVIEPASAKLTVAERQQFRASLYDANDQVIPNVTLRWYTQSGNGGQTNAASINASGMLSTVAVGNILIGASFDYSANGGTPGFERQVQAMATASIEPPKTYQLKRLASTAAIRSGLELRARIVPILGNDRGQLVFNASLSGLGNGPLMLDGGETALLASAGTPGPLPQTSITDFNDLALNNRGVVLARMSAAFSNNYFLKLMRQSADVAFIENTPLVGSDFVTGSYFNRNCLNESGDFVMRGTYRVENSGPLYTALFRVRERALPDRVITNANPLGEMAEGFTLDNDFGIADSGLTYFTATSGTRRFLWARTTGTPVKLVAAGDALLGSTVRQFYGNGFFMGPSGDLAVAVLLNNNEIHLLRFSGTNLSAPPRTLRLRSFSAVYAVHPEHGVLFLGDGQRGYGVNWWGAGDQVTPVLLQNSADYLVRGKRVTQIDYAALGAGGEVRVLARTEDFAMELLRAKAGEPTVSILQSGAAIAAEAPMSIAGILQGARTGPAHLLTGGFASSILEASDGDLKPVIVLGERFTGVQLYTGANNTNAHKAPNGDIYVTQTGGAGVLRIRGDQREFVLRAPIALGDGVTANAPSSIFVNSRGDMLWQASTNRGDTRLVLTRDGAHVALAAIGAELAGKPLAAWSGLAMDDAGRAMALFRFTDNSTALYLWTGAEWKHMLTPGVTEHAGRQIVSIGTMRASADAFFVVANLSGIGNTLLAWKQDRFETSMAVDELIVTGHVANSIGTFDVNRAGDLFVQCNTNSQVLVVRRGGKSHYIQALNELTPDGDLIVRTTEYDIRDDGTVYFLGLTASDEYVLYQATPL